MAARDATPGAWVADGIRGFAESVLSVVPAGFESYVRVFHPAERAVTPDHQELATVSWGEIAAALGRTAHAGMQLAALIGFEPRGSHEVPGVYDYEPSVGSLPVATATALARVLERHTATPQECFFAVWSGWGGLRTDVEAAPEFTLPHREYNLMQGPIRAATETVEDFGGPDREWRQLANIWWPADHAWCLATEIDFDTTYLGCSAACCNDLLAHAAVEALEIDPSHGVTIASDRINPPPANAADDKPSIRPL